MLGSRGVEGFSKSTGFRGAEHRPHGRHHEAVGGHHRTMSEAILRGRLADNLPEGSAERSQAGKADLEADVGDAARGFAQEEHRPFHSPSLQVAVRCLSEGGTKAADEMLLGEIRSE